MKPALPLLTLTLASTLALGPGCISTEETVYRDLERLPVTFENETAGRLFYQTLSELPPRQSSERHSEVHIPIIFKHSHTEKDSGNTLFNDAVRRCDANKDSVISETEARIFAETKGR